MGDWSVKVEDQQRHESSHGRLDISRVRKQC